MSDRELLELARKAGFRTGEMHMQDGLGTYPYVTSIGDGCVVELRRFAALVAANEREECAMVCEAHAASAGSTAQRHEAMSCRDAIRARRGKEATCN